MELKSFITGLAGPELDREECTFIRGERPCGLILFDRNIENPDQLKRLIDDFREALGSSKALILIDQEGGRIQRMREPHWRHFPAPARYGELYRQDPRAALEAARLVYRLMMDDLVRAGFNTDCVPLLDIPRPGASEVIGDRAFADDLKAITELGRAVAEGCLEGGVLPVIKHLPGHGRAGADSHQSLPVIDAGQKELEKSDFLTFRALNDLPLGMTGHLLFTDIDPKHHASISPVVIKEIIRGFIGFDGLLMSDDIYMGAMSGSQGERARDVIAAGCDVALYCKGELEQMKEVAANVPPLAGKPKERFERAMAMISPPRPFDHERAEELLGRLQG